MSSKSSQSKSAPLSSSNSRPSSSRSYASYTSPRDEKSHYAYAHGYGSSYSYDYTSINDNTSWCLPNAIDIEDEDITFDGQPLSALYEEARCGYSPSSSPQMDERRGRSLRRSER